MKINALVKPQESYLSSPQRHRENRASPFFDCRETAAIKNPLPLRGLITAFTLISPMLSIIIGFLFIVTIGASTVYAQTGKEAPASSVSQGQVPVDSDKYLIGPEDVLNIHVWKEEALTQTVTVRTDGKITLPLIDEVQATGLTPLQLKELLTQKFKAYVEDPIVTVMVREGKSFKVYITGQVSRPGVINLIGEVSFLQFVAQVGGFTDWANQKKILIIRKEGDKENRILVNYKKIVSGDAPNFMLKPGDVIIVPD